MNTAIPAGPCSPPSAAPPAESSAAEARRLADAMIKRTDMLIERLERRFDELGRKIDAIAALIVSPQAVHAVEPAPDLELNPVFDSHGREIDIDAYSGTDYPLTATCRCCRQIMLAGPGLPWAHCD